MQWHASILLRFFSWGCSNFAGRADVAMHGGVWVPEGQAGYMYTSPFLHFSRTPSGHIFGTLSEHHFGTVLDREPLALPRLYAKMFIVPAD